MGIFADPARFMKRALAAAALLLVLAQLVRVDRTNPPATSTIQASAAIDSILRRSCFDCHSNETTWPLYSGVAPMSWIVASPSSALTVAVNPRRISTPWRFSGLNPNNSYDSA